MAGGVYSLDPVTGQPLIQTAGGAMLPVPLSEQELQANGLRLADVPKPDLGPDMRIAGRVGAPIPPMVMPSGASGRRNASAAELEASQAEAAERAAATQAEERAHLEKLAQAGGRAGASAQLALQKAAQEAPPPVASAPKADPGGLVRVGAASQAEPGGGGDSGMDPLLRQVFEESLRGGGGGGPRRMGVSGETRKYSSFERPIDPELKKKADDAQLASDAYNEQFAKLLQQRQLQAYEAQQSEYAARSGQLAAAQERFEQQQAMLADYSAKRDAAIEEARQMKAPQMEEYWGSRGTLANVMTGLSIALGGALQGLRGGQNPGLEMSNQSIERWLQAQQEDYRRAEARADRLDSQYSRLVQQFGSENQALEHLRLQAWEVRDGMLKSYAEKVGTPDALEAYNQAMLAGEAEKAAALARASQGAEVEIEQKLSMQGGGGGRSSLRKAISDTASAKKDLDVLNGNDGQPVVKPSDMKDVNISDASLASVRQMLNSYRGSEEIPGLGDPNVVSRAVRSAADFVGGTGSGSKLLDSKEERANRQNTQNLVAGIIQSISGAGVSNEERANLNEMIRGARTKADLENIVNIISTKNAEFRRLAAGGRAYAPAAPDASEEAVP